MATTQTGEKAISDRAVKDKTGRVWNDWMGILDRWGAQSKDHTSIARYLKVKYKLSPWWSQAVTVRYELERGLRTLGERANGKFELSVQRTIRASATKAYEAFSDPKQVSTWFTTRHRAVLKVGGAYRNEDGDQGTFLILEPRRRLKFTWDNKDHCPGTVVEVTFTPAGNRKVAVRLQHTKLQSRAEREDMKGGWSWAMDSFKSYLETGEPIPHEEWLADKKKS